MDVTRVDHAGKINLPLNISNQCGIKPGVHFQVNVKGNSIVLTKIDHLQDNRDDGRIQDMLHLSECSLRDLLQNEPGFPRVTDFRVRIVVDFLIS